MSTDNLLNDSDFSVVDDQDIVDLENEQESKIPSKYDPEWPDYVLSLLTDDEKVNGNPKADGLVRVAGLLYGEGFCDLKVHYATPSAAAVTYLYQVGNANYIGSAECSSDNTDEPYSKYPLATAETRAIGRAMKRVLKLTNVLTAEESSKKAELTAIPDDGIDRTEGSITDTQIKFIDRVCKSFNINVEKAVKYILGDDTLSTIKSLSHKSALHINSILDQWKREDTNESYKDIGSYDDNWQNSFNKEV